MAQIAAELNISQTGLTLNHPWVRQLAGVGTTGPINMDELRGQTGQVSGSAPTIEGGSLAFSVNFAGAGLPFFRGNITHIGQGTVLNVSGNASITYTGNLRAVNNSSGVQYILAYAGGQSWQVTANNFLRSGTDTYSFYPST